MCSLWHFPRMSVCVLDGTVLFFLDVMRRFISFPWYQSLADRESLGRNYTKKRSTLCPSIWFCRLWLISFEFPTNWAEIMMPSHLVCLSLASSQQIFLIEFKLWRSNPPCDTGLFWFNFFLTSYLISNKWGSGSLKDLTFDKKKKGNNFEKRCVTRRLFLFFVHSANAFRHFPASEKWVNLSSIFSFSLICRIQSCVFGFFIYFSSK